MTASCLSEKVCPSAGWNVWTQSVPSMSKQKYMYNNHTHKVSDQIVSVSQPFVRPIAWGKVGKPVKFGAKLDFSVCR